MEKNWKVNFAINPFKLYKISNVFSEEEDVSKLSKELEKIKYKENMTDMFHLSQTADLNVYKNSKIFRMIPKFFTILDRLRKYLVEELNIQVEDKISVSSSRYSNREFLLCHDDKCDDRLVAFIFYLNPVWKHDWGGSLDLFDHDDDGQPSHIVHSIFPEFNSLIFFQVGNYTYHQVSEVLTNESSRITINGWFHSIKAYDIVPLSYTEKYISFEESADRDSLLYHHHFISNEFLWKKYYSIILDIMKGNGVIMLQNFLKPHVFQKISNELRSSSVKWIHKGPANRRKYDVADNTSFPPLTKAFINLLQSNITCSYLEAISGHKLRNHKKVGESSSLTNLEIQFWKSGYYSILSDCDQNLKSKTLDVWIFFNVIDNIGGSESLDIKPGNINYIKKGREFLENSIEPANNSICIFSKKKNVTSFVPYISKKCELQYQALCFKIQSY